MLLRFPSREDLIAEQCRRRLLPFVEAAWPIIEPKATFVNGWHIGFMCEHLEAVHLGQIGDVMFNVPPGCMKSILTSVNFPAWEWGPRQRPDLRYLCGSYDEGLSIRDARKSRDIITSAWYQRHFVETFKNSSGALDPWSLRDDQNTKTRYDNTQSGWRIATSVGGKGTGEHPHRKIVDDPHNVKKSLSDVLRKEAITWFDLTMGSRGIGLNAVTILIMQRLHEQDLSGHVLDTLREHFTVVILPMRYEPPARVEVHPGQFVEKPRMEPTPIGSDPRTQPGELLWPAFLDEPKVAKLESQLRAEHGDYGIAGQLQQRPAPMGGGMFKREWFRIIERMPVDDNGREVPVVARARGWDGAGTEGGGDYTAGVRIAKLRNGVFVVEDVVRGQWGPANGDAVLKQTVQTDPKGTRQREEQEPGSAGKKVCAAHALMLSGHDYRFEPATGDKATRARTFASNAENGLVFLMKGAWNKPYLDELATFPHGSHDDQVDGSSTAFNDIALVKGITTQKIVGY